MKNALRQVRRVYLAGKISDGRGTWRNRLRKYPCDKGESYCASEEWAGREKELVGGYVQTGPFFEQEHGWTGPSHSHGVGELHVLDWRSDLYFPSRERSRREWEARVVLLCTEAIRRSDAVFWWIDSKDCYGTLAEIGYARALGVPVFALVDKLLSDGDVRDLWFALRLATDVTFGVLDPSYFLAALAQLR